MFIFNLAFKLFIAFQVTVFRLSGGRLMASLRGMPVLLLTTTGRKSGKRRTTPLMYLRDGETYVITASNNGRPHRPGWFYNLKADPEVQIEVPGKTLAVQAAVAPPEARARFWAELVARAPFFAGHQRAVEREIPMVVLSPR